MISQPLLTTTSCHRNNTAVIAGRALKYLGNTDIARVKHILTISSTVDCENPLPTYVERGMPILGRTYAA